MKEIILSNYSGEEKYTLVNNVTDGLTLKTPSGFIYELNKRNSRYNFLSKIFNFNPNYEYTIPDVTDLLYQHHANLLLLLINIKTQL